MAEDLDFKNQLRITNTIYFSLILGLIFFCIIAVVFIQDKESQPGNEIDSILTIVVPVYGFLIMLISKILYTKLIAKQNAGNSLLQKIVYYRTVKIISWAMIESACILALVALMVTSNYFYLVVFVFLFGYFIFLKPSKESLVRDLQLKSDESDLLLRN